MTSLRETALPADAPLRVTAGDIIAYRLLDIAYAIDLARAETLWSSRPGAPAARKRLQATPPKAVAYDVPPLVLSLDTVQLHLGDDEVAAEITARVYDFGVLTLALRVPASGLDWDSYSARLQQVHACVGPGSDNAVWRDLTATVCRGLGASLTRPAPSLLEEDYLVAVVRAFDRPFDAAGLLDTLDLAPLLSGERMTLSPAARHDLLRNRFSYYTDDLAVLTWDRAFLFEPRGDSDVLDVLEVANAQLLEMRYYDELLDDELPRMYHLVETTQRGSRVFGSRRFAKLARRLYTLVAEVTELTERAENTLQVTEDVYLARIYSASLDLFRVRIVAAAVDRKLAIIRDTYAALYDEASGARAAAMELAIVLLIILEVVLAILRPT